MRTPRGKARRDGALATIPPQELIAQLIGGLAHRGAKVESAEALVLGCVGQIGDQGGNIALVSKLHTGLAPDVSAWTLNNYCVSALTAVTDATSRIHAGQISVALAGGVECMSRVGFMADQASFYTDRSLPADARYAPVAVAADRLAWKTGVDRQALDQAALRSHARATAAEENPALSRSRIAVSVAQGAPVGEDECVRPSTTLETLAALPPAFDELADAYRDALGNETFPALHTVAHAPPMVDGAALCLLSADAAGARARIVAIAERGGNARDGLTAGFAAMQAVLAQSGRSLADMDRIEFMEAFAVVMELFLREHPEAADRTNVGGGHLARGHPMGASGGILLSTLLDALDACKGRYGLVAATGASGVGAAMIVERL